MKSQNIFIILAFLLFNLDLNARWITKKNKRSIRVVQVKGLAKLKKHRENVWIPILRGMELAENDHIRTGENGFVQLLLEDSSVIEVKEKGDLSLDALNEKRGGFFTQLKLWKGAMMTQVSRLKKKKDKFEIATPTIVAAVRGTTVYTEVKSGKGKIISHPENGAGSLFVYTPKREKETRELPPGNFAIADKEGKGSKIAPEKDDTLYALGFAKQKSKPTAKEESYILSLIEKCEDLRREVQKAVKTEENTRDINIEIYQAKLTALTVEIESVFRLYEIKGYGTEILEELKVISLGVTHLIKEVNQKIIRAFQKELNE